MLQSCKVSSSIDCSYEGSCLLASPSSTKQSARVCPRPDNDGNPRPWPSCRARAGLGVYARYAIGEASSSDDHSTRRRPAASASGIGVAGVASASATYGDQTTPATARRVRLSSTRPPDHEPADAMLMHTSRPVKSLARKGQRRSRPGL